MVAETTVKKFDNLKEAMAEFEKLAHKHYAIYLWALSENPYVVLPQPVIAESLSYQLEYKKTKEHHQPEKPSNEIETSRSYQDFSPNGGLERLKEIHRNHTLGKSNCQPETEST